MVWCCFAAQNLTKCAAELHRFFVTHKNGGCLLRVLITSLVGCRCADRRRLRNALRAELEETVLFRRLHPFSWKTVHESV